VGLGTAVIVVQLITVPTNTFLYHYVLEEASSRPWCRSSKWFSTATSRLSSTRSASICP
jgi:hypothetical protein